MYRMNFGPPKACFVLQFFAGTGVLRNREASSAVAKKETGMRGFVLHELNRGSRTQKMNWGMSDFVIKISTE